MRLDGLSCGQIDEVRFLIHQYLKENLRIDFTTSTENGYGGTMEKWTRIEVFLGDDKIIDNSF